MVYWRENGRGRGEILSVGHGAEGEELGSVEFG